MEFDRTIQLHPDFLSAYYYLALMFSKSGEPKLAAEVAQAALTRNPNYSCVFPFVSVADVQAGQPPR
jgi:Tfp pilus assembly protein PilF